MVFASLRTRNTLAAAVLGIAAASLTLAAQAEQLTAIVGTTAPSWAQSMTPGTWTTISKNVLSSLDPADSSATNPNYPNTPPWNGSTGQKSVIDSWSGGAFASRSGAKGALILFGGGHMNYYGSEVYSFDLATQMWTRVTNPYKGNLNWPYTTGTYPDGSPSPPHTYDMIAYHPPSNSFVTLTAAQDNDPTTRAETVHMLDLGTKQWRHSKMNSINSSDGGWSAYDSTRDVFWLQGGGSATKSPGLVKFDPNVDNGDGTYGKYTNYSPQLARTDSVAAYDPIHDIIAVATFREYSSIYGIDPKNPEATPVTLKEAGTAPSKESASGWEWSPSRSAFIYWRRGGDVYEFAPSGTDWKGGVWSWSKLTSGSNSVTPQAMNTDNGIYGRFQVVSYQDMDIAVVVNRIDGPVYAFRLPSGIRPRAPDNVTAQ
jgi:hypothetical protein